MKTKVFSLLTIFILGMTIVLPAQPGLRFPRMRERIANARFNEIAGKLGLEPSVSEKLRPIYLEYEKEKGLILNGSRPRDLDLSTEGLTDEQAEKIYFLLLDKAKRMIGLREKYYIKFRTVLKPAQILRFHRIEEEVNGKMLRDMKQKLNERFPR